MRIRLVLMFSAIIGAILSLSGLVLSLITGNIAILPIITFIGLVMGGIIEIILIHKHKSEAE